MTKMKTYDEVKDKIKEVITREQDNGNVVINTGIEGLQSIPIKQLLNQPLEGLLYDINRLPEVILTFIDDEKWINDYACYLVIKKLWEDNKRMKKQMRKRD